MLSSDPRYGNYLKILQEELVPATGCTEPIAIAYGAAKARELLGVLPESVLVEASGNIIKNVKSVVVPNTNSLKGIEAAAAAGIVAGQSDKILEVISEVTPAQRAEIRVYLADHPIVVKPAEGDKVFDILITLRAGNNHVKLRISDYHTHIVYIEKNGEVLFQSGEVLSDSARDMLTDRSCLSVEGVLDFASTCNLEDVRALIERQIDYNYAIAEEGMRHSWGANIGSVLKEHYGVGIYSRARYMAAAGSDARMSGCEMPVIIVSGSGNQGITASVPVVEYAKELNVSRDQMVRAVLLSDLLTIHLKTGIGRLSAYCGAVSAGCSAGAAIAYLHGGGFREIAHTLVNSLAIVSGMICDGAKASCAAKISAAVDAGLVGYSMFRSGQQFRGGDGIVTKGVEETIRNIGRLGRLGMRETDREIIRIMTNQPASEEAD
ncbi:MAG: serine dehydratase subunit alpha family protein [Christensenellales bacterium]|nr:serine dehydratase subunit alpha family protein [Clostridiales bacterium]MEE0401106.1 L-serine ammonia-lyase, iron-sulfur-dependent, subunit alpha [Christensenellales bacterium]